MEKKDLKKRLKQYGSMAAALTATQAANATIIYTDEAPDFNGGVGSQYFLDLNNDATDDFRIWHNGSSNLYISPLTSQNNVLGSGGATFAYPFALSSGAIISSGAGTFFNNGYAGGFQSLNYGSCSFGNWCGVTDRYIGLQFNVGGNTHYGWVRLDVDFAGNVWTVKDYAYEDIVGNSIAAGAMGTPGSASPSTGIIGVDVADNGNGQDLDVTFTASADETTVSEYRIMAVKSANAGTFNLAAADVVPVADYTAVTPNASPTYNQILAAGATDVDGDPIVNAQPYRLFILNVADGVNATTNSLSQASADVTLHVQNDSAINIVASDVNNNVNGSDLQVDFDAAPSEAGITEYRIIAVKDINAGTFDIPAAEALPATAYATTTPNGGPYSVNLGAATTDSDGDPIINAQAYTIFVYSLFDGTVATLANMNSSAATITLNNQLDAPTNVVGTDIADNSDASDVEVTWDGLANETGLQEYRVFIVKSANAGTFDYTAANAAVAGMYGVVNPTGSPSYSLNLVSFQNDVDGDPIMIGVDYVAFVMSKDNGTPGTIGDLSAGSAVFSLTTPADVALNVLGQDAGNNQNGTDARLDFNAAADETTVLEYRSIVVKTAAAGSFDLAAAQALPSTAYKVVTPTGAPNYAEALDATTTDSDGDPIADNVDYTAFVMSVQNGSTSNEDNLSAPSASFMLTTALSLEEGGLDGVTSFFSNGQLVIDAGSNQELSFTLFDLSGKIILDDQLNPNVNKFVVNQLSTGLYLVRLSDGKGNTFTQKIVLQ